MHRGGDDVPSSLWEVTLPSLPGLPEDAVVYCYRNDRGVLVLGIAEVEGPVRVAINGGAVFAADNMDDGSTYRYGHPDRDELTCREDL